MDHMHYLHDIKHYTTVEKRNTSKKDSSNINPSENALCIPLIDKAKVDRDEEQSDSFNNENSESDSSYNPPAVKHK